jgi:hypothetical protein
MRAKTRGNPTCPRLRIPNRKLTGHSFRAHKALTPVLENPGVLGVNCDCQENPVFPFQEATNVSE